MKCPPYTPAQPVYISLSKRTFMKLKHVKWRDYPVRINIQFWTTRTRTCVCCLISAGFICVIDEFKWATCSKCIACEKGKKKVPIYIILRSSFHLQYTVLHKSLISVYAFNNLWINLDMLWVTAIKTVHVKKLYFFQFLFFHRFSASCNILIQYFRYLAQWKFVTFSCIIHL